VKDFIRGIAKGLGIGLAIAAIIFITDFSCRALNQKWQRADQWREQNRRR
jgi:hypothetical protein